MTGFEFARLATRWPVCAFTSGSGVLVAGRPGRRGLGYVSLRALVAGRYPRQIVPYGKIPRPSARAIPPRIRPFSKTHAVRLAPHPAARRAKTVGAVHRPEEGPHGWPRRGPAAATPWEPRRNVPRPVDTTPHGKDSALCRLVLLHLVRRTLDRPTIALQHVRVDLRCTDVLVPQQLLHRADVAASLQQPSREGMPKSVGRGVFVDACFAHGLLHRTPETRRINVMPSYHAAARIPRRLRSRKHILPAPFANP